MYIIGDFWWVWLILTVVCAVYILINVAFSLALGGCVDEILTLNTELRWYQRMFLGVWKLLTALIFGAMVLVLLIASIIINIIL